MAEPASNESTRLVSDNQNEQHKLGTTTSETVQTTKPKIDDTTLTLNQANESLVAPAPAGKTETSSTPQSIHPSTATVITQPEPETHIISNTASISTSQDSTSSAPTVHQYVSAPTAVADPDEDTLDDLDDMLDDFNAAKIDDAPISAPPLTSVHPADSNIPASLFPTGENGAENFNMSNNPFVDPSMESDDFAKELQEGMADLISEFESSPDMKAQFEQMLKGFRGGSESGAMPGVSATTPQAATVPPTATPGISGTDSSPSFQESIRRTMERMQASGDAAEQAAAEASQGEGDLMAALLKEMEAGGLGGEEDFSKMLMGMMEQLTNKEILYEPMKELHEKFPDWLEKNKENTNAADLARYEKQQKLVEEIVTEFEKPGYTDENVDSRAYIVERMQEMQAAGSPPSDLVGDINAAQEALGELDSGCPTQ